MELFFEKICKLLDKLTKRKREKIQINEIKYWKGNIKMKTRYSESYKHILKISMWWYLGLCCHRGPCLCLWSYCGHVYVDVHGLCCSLKPYWCLLVMLPLGATLMWMAFLLPGAIVMPSKCYLTCDAAHSHVWVCGPTTVWVYVDIWLLWPTLPPQAMQISYSMLWPKVILLFVG